MTDTFDAETLSARDSYRLMTDIIAPRPIAWASTLGPDGVVNLAPFSYFQAVCSAPPTVVLSVGTRGGVPKDTLANVLRTREITISHVTHSDAEAMNATAADYAPDRGEAAALEIPLTPSDRVGPPRVATARAALECELQHALPLGHNARSGGPSTTLLIARVLRFHVAQGLALRNEDGRLLPIDPGALDAVGRLGGVGYTSVRERFELERPPKPE
jgi:flavin reductase (DIM6/NTAB) family NADH-FMN oxidoreductase RutF